MSFAALSVGVISAIAAAVLASVIGIYLLRPTPRHQLVSNIGFWLKAVQRARSKLLFSRRVPIIALLVTLTVALLYVFELGDPRFGRGSAGTTVYVLDADRTMSARVGTGRRIDAALARLRQRAQQDTLAGQVALLRAGAFTDVVVPLTTRPADIERALGGIRTDDGIADLGDALARADRIIAETGQRGRIVLFTDRPLPPTDRRGLRAPVDVIGVGEPGETVAITQFGARRDPNAMGEYAVYAEVRAFTTRPARARLVIRDRNVVISEERLTLTPGSVAVHRAQGFSSGQGEVSARLEDIRIDGLRDMLDTDDVAFAAVEPLTATRVLLVSEGDAFLPAALETNPNVALTRMTPPQFETRRADPRFSAELAQFRVVVLDRYVPPRPLDHPAQMLVAPPPRAGWQNGPILENPRVTAFAGDHPVLASVRFDQVRVAESYVLGADNDDRILVRSERHPIVVARDRPGQRTVVFGFPMGSTDLVRRVAFPLLMHNTLVWLDRRDTAYRSWQQPGEPIRAPRGATAVLTPSRQGRDVRAGAFFDAVHAGIYHAGERALAVSGVDNAGALTTVDRGRAGTTATRARPPLAVLVAAALLLLMLIEWVLLQRGRLP